MNCRLLQSNWFSAVYSTSHIEKSVVHPIIFIRISRCKQRYIPIFGGCEQQQRMGLAIVCKVAAVWLLFRKCNDFSCVSYICSSYDWRLWCQIFLSCVSSDVSTMLKSLLNKSLLKLISLRQVCLGINQHWLVTLPKCFSIFTSEAVICCWTVQFYCFSSPFACIISPSTKCLYIHWIN